MKIEHLREFAVLAKHMSFSAAAKELYMTQPGLSSHIQQMEKELGFELVERSQPMRLTAAGSEVLKGGQQIINQYESMLHRAKSAGENRPLRIHEVLSVPGIIEGLDATDVAHEFVPYDFERGVLGDLENGVVDITFMLHAPSDNDQLERLSELGLWAQTVARGNIVICVERNSPLGLKESLSLSDLDGVETVVFSAGWFDTWTRAIEHAFGERVTLNFRLEPKCSLANVRRAILNGAAYVCTEQSVNHSMGSRDDLTIHTMVDGKHVPYEWLAVCKAENKRAAELIDYLHQRV